MGKLLAILSIVMVGSAKTPEIRKIASNGDRRVQLIELFSSESCSSCPPADAWISNFKNDRDLWSEFVPVVFHVDYWNDLGWQDELSTPEMTKRQRSVVATWPANTQSVYTPSVVVSGTEWRDWSSRAKPKSEQGTFPRLTILEEGLDQYSVVVENAPSQENYTVRLALLGIGIDSNVTSGENRGRKLSHNFVVLDWEGKLLQGKKVDFQLSKNKKHAQRYALAAWLEKKDIPIPVQAVGGYL